MADSKISRYELKSKIGRGGMAVVYQAHDPRFKRDVAVKLMSRELMDDPTFRVRFEREAQTIAALEHPAIVPVYDFGEDDGRPYLVMRLMTGGTLADRLAEGALSIQETVTVLGRIGSALERAHGMGVIHRDLKPSNIMFDQYGDAFLADFGIVRVAESSVTLTGQAVIGTPAYMSPEQVYGDKEVDGRSDIYALGIICFEMLTGRPPYDDQTPAKLMMKHVMEPVPDIRAVNPNVPPGIAAVIARTMAKEPDDRFSTPTELTDTLAAAARGESLEGAAAAGEAVAGEAVAEEAAAEAAEASAAVMVGPAATPPEAVPPPVTPAPAPETEVAARTPSELQPSPAARRGRRVPIWAWIVGGVAAMMILLAIVVGGFAIANLLTSSEGSEGAVAEATSTPAERPDEMVGDESNEGQPASEVEPDEFEESPPEQDPSILAEEHMEAFYAAMESEDFDDAIREVSQAIELMPEEPWYYHERAYAHKETHDLEAAIEDFSRAIDLEPDNADHYVGRGYALLDMGDIPVAVDNFREAVMLQPDNAHFHFELGSALLYAGEADEAIHQLNEAIALAPEEPFYYEGRANAYYEIGEHGLAIEDFDRAIELDPGNAYYYAGRAYVFRELGDLDAALAGFGQAIELEPDAAEFYMELGYTQRDWFDNPEAGLEFFARASEVQPDNPDPYAEMGGTLHFLGDYDGALEHLGRCIDVDPGFYWCYWERAWTLDDLNDVDAAIADFEAFLANLYEGDCPECAEEAHLYIEEHSRD